VNGDDSGLHHSDYWIDKGRECVDYWTRQNAGLWPQVEVRTPAERLQLGAATQIRPGFRGLPSQARPHLTGRQELQELMSLPDSSCQEILVLGAYQMQPAELACWLGHCDRMLVAGGTLCIRCTPTWRRNAAKIIADSPLRFWRVTWETSPDSTVAIFLKAPASGRLTSLGHAGRPKGSSIGGARIEHTGKQAGSPCTDGGRWPPRR
jgi:hypothetical protein